MNIKSRMKYDKKQQVHWNFLLHLFKQTIIIHSFIMVFRLFEPKVIIYSPVSIQGLPSPPSAPL